MDLYQELILEHSKRPHHAGLREPYSAEVHHQPDLRRRGHPQGCPSPRTARTPSCETSPTTPRAARSRSSSSVLADEVIGRPVSQALTTFEAMREMLTSKGKVAGDEEVIGDGVAFRRRGEVSRPGEVCAARLDRPHRRPGPLGPGHQPRRHGRPRWSTPAEPTPAQSTTAQSTTSEQHGATS